MSNSWVIIWVSTFCKDEGVEPEVYLNKEKAQSDADRLNMNDSTRRFHVVEYEGKEHKNALKGVKDPFR